MDFNEYLISKKIDPDKLKSGEKELYHNFHNLFAEMHPDSFTNQKLFLINQLRRKYILEEQQDVIEKPKPKKMKPKMPVKGKPKPQIPKSK